MRLRGIDLHKVLRVAPAQSECMLIARCGSCNMIVLGGGGGSAQRDSRVWRRQQGLLCVLYISVTSGPPYAYRCVGLLLLPVEILRLRPQRTFQSPSSVCDSLLGP